MGFVPSPSLAELRVLECAVRTGSLSAAARDLGLSQQAVSARLRGLERLIGLELVHRSPAGVAPTPAGDTVLAGAHEVLAAAARLDAAIAELRGGSGAPALRVAASQTIAAHLLPDWIVELRGARLSAGLASVQVELRTANSEQVIALVRGGDADLGFIEQPEAPRGLAHAIVRHDRMVVAVAPQHAWAGREMIPVDELARAPLVTREAGSGTRAAFERAVRERLGAEAAPPLMSLATEAAVRSAVARGVAPAVLSELTVLDDARLGRIVAVPIGPAAVRRPLVAIWRGDARDLIGARRHLVEVAAAHGRAAG